LGCARVNGTIKAAQLLANVVVWPARPAAQISHSLGQAFVDGREIAWIMHVLVYEFICRITRLFDVPISLVFGSHDELQEIMINMAVPPGKTLELGCGDGRDAIFLAQHGFDVTGVDFSPAAIEMGRVKAREAGLVVTFIEDDLTNLQHVNDTFDLLVDYGTLDDLRIPQRDL
jgi:SAM-dependent methyltransferase